MAALHVSTSGADTNPGDSSRPFKTPQKAESVARPGDEILLHAGTYTGVLTCDKPGTATAPITLKAAGDGPVTLTASLPAVSVGSYGPTLNRTLRILASYWRVSDISIVGGILVIGNGVGRIQDGWLHDHTAPGCGELPDPEAHENLPGWLDGKGAAVTAIYGVELRRLKITRRGIYPALAMHGVIDACDIGPIDGGTGGGAWLGRGSSFWSITNNRIHDLAASYNPNTNAQHHWMSECIRLATLSSYCVVENNLTYNALGLGRGVNCDVNSNHHVFRANTSRNCHRGMSNQKSCWGCLWEGNLMEDSREMGFSVGDETRRITMRCNESQRAAKRDLWISHVTRSVFEKNAFRKLSVKADFAPQFGALGSTYEGKTTVPVTADMDVSAFGTCGPTGSSLT